MNHPVCKVLPREKNSDFQFPMKTRGFLQIFRYCMVGINGSSHRRSVLLVYCGFLCFRLEIDGTLCVESVMEGLYMVGSVKDP